jgi:hypothetical protein
VVVSHERTRRTAGVVFVALLVADVALSVVARDPWPTDDGLVLVLLAASAALGYVIARTEPRNPIGWIFLALGLSTCFDYVARLYLIIDYRQHGGGLPLGAVALFWRSSWTLFPFLLVFPAILLFPDGRLTPRWRAILRAYIIVAVVFEALQVAGAAIDPSTATGPGGVDIRGDLHNGGGVVAGLGFLFAPLILAAWVAFVWHQVAAWRSASGVRRAQLKWLALGSAICIVSSVVIVVLGDGTSTTARLAADLGAVGVGVLPVAFGVAILRYRLYEIDRLVSRTLAYALLTALLVGTFAGIVLLTTRVLPFSSPVAVAASTLAAAALFNPLRTRVQRLVDRRFNRARYDRDMLVANAVEPAHVSVWVRT